MTKRRQSGDHDADRNAGGSLLPEVEGDEGQVVGSGDLPIVDGAITENGKGTEGPRAEEIRKRMRARDRPGYQQRLRDWSAAELSVLAPVPLKTRKWKRVNANFMKALNDRMFLYRYDALEALRDLAMMPISDNSMQNNVKYLAASRLLGPPQESATPQVSDDGLLKALNESYQKHSTRIKEVRERIITMESVPAITVERAGA